MIKGSTGSITASDITNITLFIKIDMNALTLFKVIFSPSSACLSTHNWTTQSISLVSRTGSPSPTLTTRYNQPFLTG